MAVYDWQKQQKTPEAQNAEDWKTIAKRGAIHPVGALASEAGLRQIVNPALDATDKFLKSGLTGYILDAYEHPRQDNILDPRLLISTVGHMTEDAFNALPNAIANWLSGDDEDKSEDFDRWFQNYLASGGRGDAGGIGAGLAGTPFPSIGGYAPDWKTLRDAQAGIKAPEYHEQAFNPANTIANMLMNADWINMDMSRSGKIMQDAFNRRAEDNAKVANATEEAKYNAARDKLNTALQLEKLRAESAQQAAQLAIARWNAMQPKALGGNKMFWRDSQGNLHFEAVDKQGEARTLGTNEALAWLTSLDDKSLKKITDKDIVNAAKKSLWSIEDKAAQIPWMQGFILQAQEYRNLAKNKEK